MIWDGEQGVAKFSGVPGSRCPKAPENGKPTAFLINRGSAKGIFQDDFVNGEVQHSKSNMFACGIASSIKGP